MIYDVIIMGSGASGMMAALTALKKNKTVLIIDKMKIAGKKLRATGNGKCNFTNKSLNSSYYFGHNTDICKKALALFDEKDSVAFFENIGIPAYEKNGYVYPMSESAGAFTDVLVNSITALGGHFALDMKVLEVVKDKIFTVKTSYKTFQGKSVILSTGGASYKSLGGDIIGYDLAKAMGHKVYDPFPALTGLKFPSNKPLIWNGVRCKAELTILANDVKLASDSGELQLTAYGISGIPAFQVSRFCSLALNEGKRVLAVIDFAPGYSEEELYDYLIKLTDSKLNSVKDIMIGMFNQKLIDVFLKACHMPTDAPLSILTSDKVKKLCGMIKHFCKDIIDTNGFDNAQVTAGGIDTTEINYETMESKLVSGLYITGEVMDIDGICGGYNLQWAWTTGYLAGLNAGE